MKAHGLPEPQRKDAILELHIPAFLGSSWQQTNAALSFVRRLSKTRK